MKRILLGTVVLSLCLSNGTFRAEAASGELREAAECRIRGGLPHVFEKLQKGREVRIAYLGGSITAQPGWRVKTLAWFRQQYPQAQVKEINAAIGGTGSELGVFRLEHDVLRHQPDLLFVEFAVNDGGTPLERIHQAMEGIVRKTWKKEAGTDICFVYTLTEGMVKTLQAGKCWRSAGAMEALADHYGIPSIHMGIEVVRLEQEGKLIFKAPRPKTDEEKAELGDKILFSPDGVHPYPDSGHQLYFEAVVRSLLKIRRTGSPDPHKLPRPLVKEPWEEARMVPLSRARLSTGWHKLDEKKHPLAQRFGQRLGELWKANQPGETITYRFRGTKLLIYDLLGPDSGQVIVRVDEKPMKITPRFDAYCTYHRLATLAVAEGLPWGEHRVHLEIHPDQPDKARILSKRKQKIDDPKRFDDTAWYAGAILLIGEPVD